MDEDRRELSMDDLQEIGVEESNDVFIRGQGRHLAAEFIFSQITRKPSQIDENCQWTTYRKSGSGNRTVMSLPILSAT